MYRVLGVEKGANFFKTVFLASKVVKAFNLYLFVGESEKEKQKLGKKIEEIGDKV